MANFCTQCGSPVADGVKFCTVCGTPVAEAPRIAYPTGPAAQQASAQQPVYQQPVQPTQQPTARYQPPQYKQPTYQQPPQYKQPTYQQQNYQQPVQQPIQPVVQQPVQPVVQQPVQPVYQQPVYQQPVYQQPVYAQTVQPQYAQAQPQKKKGSFVNFLLVLICAGLVYLGIKTVPENLKDARLPVVPFFGYEDLDSQVVTAIEADYAALSDGESLLEEGADLSEEERATMPTVTAHTFADWLYGDD